MFRDVQVDSRKNTDDGDDDEQFDESEAAVFFHDALVIVRITGTVLRQHPFGFQNFRLFLLSQHTNR